MESEQELMWDTRQSHNVSFTWAQLLDAAYFLMDDVDRVASTLFAVS